MKIRFLAIGAALALLSGCAAPDRTVLGARRVGLDLAYSDDALKVPIPPRIITQYFPALPEELAAAFPGFNPVKVTPVPGPFACPKAPADAVPEDPATVAFATKPVLGTYLSHNVGTIKLNGAIPITVPYPIYSKLIVRDVSTKDTTVPVTGTIRTTTFVIEDQILPNYKIISTYTYDARVLNLVERDTDINGAKTTFVPSPAVEVFAFAGPGATWNSAGIDTATSNSLAVSGSIAATEPVDVCGAMIDAQKASTNEMQVDARTGNQSGTRTGKPTITHWATQYGGLQIRRETHSSQVVQTQSGPISIDTDVVSTLMSIRPVSP